MCPNGESDCGSSRDIVDLALVMSGVGQLVGVAFTIGGAASASTTVRVQPTIGGLTVTGHF